MRDGQKAVNQAVSLPQGYWLTWGGEYSQFLEAKAQLMLIGPLAVAIIFMILFALYGNFKFPVTIALGVIITEPVGALLALKLTGTAFSVSSVLGLLALLGVSVETAVILGSYINKLRLEGMDICTATREASLLRLRPIMMTALVACLGLLPAALATGIGSDTQKPFAIVIVAGSTGSSSIRCCTRWLPVRGMYFRSSVLRDATILRGEYVLNCPQSERDAARPHRTRGKGGPGVVRLARFSSHLPRVAQRQRHAARHPEGSYASREHLHHGERVRRRDGPVDARGQR